MFMQPGSEVNSRASVARRAKSLNNLFLADSHHGRGSAFRSALCVGVGDELVPKPAHQRCWRKSLKDHLSPPGENIGPGFLYNEHRIEPLPATPQTGPRQRLKGAGTMRQRARAIGGNGVLFGRDHLSEGLILSIRQEN